MPEGRLQTATFTDCRRSLPWPASRFVDVKRNPQRQWPLYPFTNFSKMTSTQMTHHETKPCFNYFPQALQN